MTVVPPFSFGQAGRTEGDADLGRRIADALAAVPLPDEDVLGRDFKAALHEMAMVCWLSVDALAVCRCVRLCCYAGSAGDSSRVHDLDSNNRARHVCGFHSTSWPCLFCVRVRLRTFPSSR